MVRLARSVRVGCVHHVTQRGNFRQPVFLRDEDYRFYRRLLHERAQKYGLAIEAYGLMTNHVHLAATPCVPDALARTMRDVQSLYARYLNTQANRQGHAWSDRYFSCIVADDRIAMVMWYIEQNPVRAGIVQRAEEYEWSSARAGILGIPDYLLTGKHARARASGLILVNPLSDEELDLIRSHTRRGRPIGSDEFRERLERELGPQRPVGTVRHS